MDDYMREMMDLKTLVTRTLEKKGVLAKIRAELRATVFEAIEEEDRALENEEGVNPALLGCCNDRAKQLHASPVGKLMTALVCDYLEWAQLSHTLKIYLPECNLPKGFWKSELKEQFGSRYESDGKNDEENGPLLLEVLEAFLKSEKVLGNASRSNSSKSPAEGASTSGLDESLITMDRQSRKASVSLVGNSHHQGRFGQGSSGSQRNSSYGNLPERHSDASSSDMGSIRKANSAASFAGTSRENGSFANMRRDDDGWKYAADDHTDDVTKAANALENIQLDKKARNLTSSWRNIDHTENDSYTERDNF